MPFSVPEESRTSLLPGWVRFFAWLFLLISAAMPAVLVSGLVYPGVMQFGLFGWEHNGTPYDAYSLSIVAYFIASGIAAFGLLWGKRWGWTAAFLMGSIGLVLSLAALFVQGLVRHDGESYTIGPRLEPLFQIPFLWVLWRIRQRWTELPESGAANRRNALRIVGALVAITSLLVLAVAMVSFSQTSGMTDVAVRFFQAVNADDIARARTYLSEEAQRTTDEDKLKRFVTTSGVTGFKTANWRERHIVGQGGELKGTITGADGEVPIELTFVKEGGRWKIYRLWRPAVPAKPVDVPALRTRAEGGDATAQTELGERLHTGKGVSKDDVESVKWFRLAAAQGLARAEFNLASMYDEGFGVQKDTTEALAWYRKAVEHGSGLAAYNLGYLYDHGDGVPKDVAQATNWYRKSAELGNAMGQVNLGVAYLRGDGVQQDDKQAALWFRKAADQDFAQAQYNLAELYAQGQGVERDDETAAAWYKKAAAQGLQRAQNKLAVCYSEGKGLAQNDGEAYFWLLVSLRNDENRIEKAAVAREHLTPNQIDEVEARAVKWQPTSTRSNN